MNKHILESLDYLLDYCETQMGKRGVVLRSDLLGILKQARESYEQAVKAHKEPEILEIKEKTKRRTKA